MTIGSKEAVLLRKKNQETLVTWRALPERAAIAVQESLASIRQNRIPS
jgi:hypothetical protein